MILQGIQTTHMEYVFLFCLYMQYTYILKFCFVTYCAIYNMHMYMVFVFSALYTSLKSREIEYISVLILLSLRNWKI